MKEAGLLLESLQCKAILTSDHSTNYLYPSGNFYEDKDRLLAEIDRYVNWDSDRFFPMFIGTQ